MPLPSPAPCLALIFQRSEHESESGNHRQNHAKLAIMHLHATGMPWLCHGYATGMLSAIIQIADYEQNVKGLIKTINLTR